MTYREAPPGPMLPDRSVLVVTGNGVVYGLDCATGALLWTNNLTGGGLGYVFIAIGHGVIVASAAGKGIFCLDYLTGVTRWEHRTQRSGRASVLIEPDRILCAKGGCVDCLTPDGRLLWHRVVAPINGAIGLPGNVVQENTE